MVVKAEDLSISVAVEADFVKVLHPAIYLIALWD